MNRKSTAAILTFSALSFVTSAATLGIVVFGARKMNAEIETVKTRTNDSVNKLKTAINSVEF